MAAIAAIFVDGTGHVKELAIHEAAPRWCFPIHQHVSVAVDAPSPSVPVSFQSATFERQGRLPDGRIVYTQDCACLKLWVLDIVVTHVAQRRCPFDLAEYQLNEWLETCGQPAVCLYRRMQRDDSQLVNRHHFEGVGREL
jgi:hypothetical protein